MPKVLVVANTTIASAKLLAAVRARAERDASTHFHIVVPLTRPKAGLVIYDAVERDAAQVRVDLALAYLRREGASADGEVGDPDPYTAVIDALRSDRFDEIIISTLPETRSGWLRRDLVERVRAVADLPVEHVVSDMETDRASFTVTLVVANRTAVSDALLARLKEKAEVRDDQLFIVVVPQEDKSGHGPPVARARLGNALDRLRGEGLLAAGMIGDPDPYVAAMNALQFYQVDEIVISTLPETRSGWLRADLIERLRKSTSCPLDHVVAEREAAPAG